MSLRNALTWLPLSRKIETRLFQGKISYQLLQILELEILLFPSKNTLKDKMGQKVSTCRIPLLTGHTEPRTGKLVRPLNIYKESRGPLIFS